MDEGCQMSLDMTMGRREAALDADEQIEADAGPETRLWLTGLLMMAASAFGVLLSSALGVLLFLR
jgi:hypothetical protein